MSNPYIKAAANDLLKAAADKRNEEREIQRQAQDLERQVEVHKRTKSDEIHSHQKFIASDPQAHEVNNLNKHIHDAQEEMNKMVELSKSKLQELTRYATKLETQARNLEGESHSLQMRA